MSDFDSLRSIWIGLIEVRPCQESNPFDQGVGGAYCTAVARASNVWTFEEIVRYGLEDYGLELVEASEVEPYSVRAASFEISDECKILVAQLSEESPVLFCTFQTFPNE